MDNIILIGMPGCGKSTCGVLVAKALCKSFVDTDLLIQAAEEMKLQDIIDKNGTAYFEAVEEKVLCSVENRNSVIATGGSAVYYESAMNHLKKNGKIIYLKISFEEMINRINNIKSRGILLKNNETMESMFRSREELYSEYADYVIDCNNSDVEQTVEKICKIFK